MTNETIDKKNEYIPIDREFMGKSEEYLKRYNAIGNYLDKNKDRIEIEKGKQDFTRNLLILDYFNANADRIPVNKNYLKEISDFLEMKCKSLDDKSVNGLFGKYGWVGFGRGDILK